MEFLLFNKDTGEIKNCQMNEKDYNNFIHTPLGLVAQDLKSNNDGIIVREHK